MNEQIDEGMNGYMNKIGISLLVFIVILNPTAEPYFLSMKKNPYVRKA